MAPGARSKFGVPMFDPEVLRKQMHCIVESTCDIVWTFQRPSQSCGAPIMIRRPGNCSPLSPFLTPMTVVFSSLNHSLNHSITQQATRSLTQSFNRSINKSLAR